MCSVLYTCNQHDKSESQKVRVLGNARDIDGHVLFECVAHLVVAQGVDVATESTRSTRHTYINQSINSRIQIHSPITQPSGHTSYRSRIRV